ncbi:hypothetical protein GCM10023331_36090 [Algivirga pacifica]|uniref:PPM-type phosphatase domain-containing protein n=2 Tax=Algivirga pacifica TaxID=1162670 RepID=A0ABP9DJG6_9BACT
MSKEERSPEIIETLTTLENKIEYFLRQDLDSALWYTQQLQQITAHYQLHNQEANAFNYFSSIYNLKGDHIKSLEYKFSALDKYTLTGYHSGTAIVHNNIGVYYFGQQDYKKALEHYLHAITLLNKHKGHNSFRDTSTWESFMSDYALNAGEVLSILERYKEALEYEHIALEYAQKHELTVNMAYIYGILGQIHNAQSNYAEGLIMIDSAIRMFEIEQDYYAVAEYHLQKANTLQAIQQPIRAGAAYETAITYAKKVGFLELEKAAEFDLSTLYAQLGKYKKAYHHFTTYNSLQTTLDSINNSASLQELQTKFETSQKESRILLLEAEKQKQYYMIIGIGMVLIVSIFLSALILIANKKVKTAYREIKEKNVEIEQQAEEISIQRDNIEEKNKELEAQYTHTQSSITYAQRIQSAMLPTLEKIQATFPESFVFLKPKDVVSGDFYFFTQTTTPTQNTIHFIATVDCTGHGVPGAFMSMIANSLLKEIIHTKKILQPSMILKELHLAVSQTLNQKNSGNQDGMDISLCRIDLINQEVLFAGAKNGLLYVQDEQSHYIKGNRQSIGGDTSTSFKAYEEHRICIKESTSFYMFSDGYQDQFGGPMKKKFMSKRLKQMLLDNHQLPMNKQVQKLDYCLTEWMGVEQEIQTDDILVMGFRL